MGLCIYSEWMAACAVAALNYCRFVVARDASEIIGQLFHIINRIIVVSIKWHGLACMEYCKRFVSNSGFQLVAFLLLRLHNTHTDARHLVTMIILVISISESSLSQKESSK